MSDVPTIVAMGGGGFTMEPDNPKLDDWVLSLAEKPSPRICFLPTASGDADSYVVDFYEAFRDRDCEPTHLGLFHRTIDDLREFVLDQDVLYVGGGNTANMLQVWRTHGFDDILEEAWRAGVVLCGLSAGSLCWYDSGVTDSFGTELAPLDDGLGLLEGSHCPHYDGEENRRPCYESLIADGTLPAGMAADDGVGLLYRDTELETVVSSREEAYAWRVEPGEDGATESQIEPELL